MGCRIGMEMKMRVLVVVLVMAGRNVWDLRHGRDVAVVEEVEPVAKLAPIGLRGCGDAVLVPSLKGRSGWHVLDCDSVDDLIRRGRKSLF